MDNLDIDSFLCYTSVVVNLSIERQRGLTTMDLHTQLVRCFCLYHEEELWHNVHQSLTDWRAPDSTIWSILSGAPSNAQPTITSLLRSKEGNSKLWLYTFSTLPLDTKIEYYTYEKVPTYPGHAKSNTNLLHLITHWVLIWYVHKWVISKIAIIRE